MAIVVACFGTKNMPALFAFQICNQVWKAKSVQILSSKSGKWQEQLSWAPRRICRLDFSSSNTITHPLKEPHNNWSLLIFHLQQKIHIENNVNKVHQRVMIFEWTVLVHGMFQNASKIDSILAPSSRQWWCQTQVRMTFSAIGWK